MRLHHAYVGGLLHHTVCVARLALSMGKTIGGVDLDLILAGALLHDIGKLREISAGLGFPYTTEGRLMAIFPWGAMLISRIAENIPDLSRIRLDELLHIILSHHGITKRFPVFVRRKRPLLFITPMKRMPFLTSSRQMEKKPGPLTRCSSVSLP